MSRQIQRTISICDFSTFRVGPNWWLQRPEQIAGCSVNTVGHIDRQLETAPQIIVKKNVSKISAFRTLWEATGSRAPRRELAQKNPECCGTGEVEVRLSDTVSSPLLVGVSRTIVVLPERMAGAEYSDALCGIFAHELAI